MMSSRTARLQELIHRQGKVLAVLHPPTAAHARLMQRAGSEALFVGTGGVVGAYTGLADVGTATLSECLEIAGWIADSVRVPVIIVSPFARAGYTDSHPATYPSLLAYIEHTFGLQPLNSSDGRAYDYVHSFDYSQKPLGPVRMVHSPIPRWEERYVATHSGDPEDPT